jgi:transposase
MIVRACGFYRVCLKSPQKTCKIEAKWDKIRRNKIKELKVPLRPINREQSWLLPPTLAELIPDDHPARFVASFVDAISEAEWQKLNIQLEGELMGAPSYHPRCLLSVWLYGFMTGTRSSRKLEGACRDQMPYLWLTGWQYPDHNTLWRFYKEHHSEMRNLLKLTVKTAIKANLIDMAVQAVDGTKIGANASKDRTYSDKGLQRLLGNL